MVRVLSPTPERARAGGFLVFLGLAISLTFPYAEATRNANELPRLVQGMALWETGSWAIDGPVQRRLDVGPDVSRSPVDTRLYPNKPPGVSLVAALAYGAARAVHGASLDLRTYTWWARLLSGALPMGCLAAFLVGRLARAFGRASAIAATGILVLASPLLAYAHLAYGHVLAAALLTVGVTGVIESVLCRPSVASATRSAVFGAIAASAVGVEYGAVWAGIPLALWMLGRLREPGRWAPVLAAALGSVGPIALLALYQEHVFGSPFATGYHHVIDPGFAAAHGRGFLGLHWPTASGVWTHVLSPRHGLLWWAPWTPAAVWGLVVAAWHPDEPVRSLARVSLATFGLYVLVVVSLGFEGGWRVGPRYLVVAWPVLGWGLAEFLTQIHHRARWIVVTVGVVTYALVVNAWAANLWPHLDDQNIHHPVAEVLWPLWQSQVEPYSALRGWGFLEVGRSCIVLTVVGGLWGLVRCFELMPKTILASVVGVAFGGALLGAVVQWPPHPRGPANLAYIQGVWEPPQGGGQAPSVPLRPLEPEALERARRGPEAATRASFRWTDPRRNAARKRSTRDAGARPGAPTDSSSAPRLR